MDEDFRIYEVIDRTKTRTTTAYGIARYGNPYYPEGVGHHRFTTLRDLATFIVSNSIDFVKTILSEDIRIPKGAFTTSEIPLSHHKPLNSTQMDYLTNYILEQIVKQQH
ncbi:MAG: hypothetical protein WC533_02745 [Candidatus Pacearchaeota archaeon]